MICCYFLLFVAGPYAATLNMISGLQKEKATI